MDVPPPSSTTWGDIGLHFLRLLPLLMLLSFRLVPDLLEFLSSLSTSIILIYHYLRAHSHLLPAPALWFCLGLLLCLQLTEWVRPPDLHRRDFRSASRSPSPSIRRRQRHYHFRLRCQGHYTVGAPPTTEARHHHHTLLVGALQRRVLALESDIHCLTRRQPPREGDNQQQSPSTRLIASMKPFLASGYSRRGSTHGLGHLGWTSRQRQAAHKIATHVHMARVSSEDAPNPAFLRMVLQPPLRFRNSIASKTTNQPIIWDSGASFSVSHNRNNFIGRIKSPGAFTQLQGISKGLRIEGLWSCDVGNPRHQRRAPSSQSCTGVLCTKDSCSSVVHNKSSTNLLPPHGNNHGRTTSTYAQRRQLGSNKRTSHRPR